MATLEEKFRLPVSSVNLCSIDSLSDGEFDALSGLIYQLKDLRIESFTELFDYSLNLTKRSGHYHKNIRHYVSHNTKSGVRVEIAYEKTFKSEEFNLYIEENRSTSEIKLVKYRDILSCFIDFRFKHEPLYTEIRKSGEKPMFKWYDS